MSPAPESTATTKNKKKQKQRQKLDSIEALATAATTNSKPDKKRKKRLPEHENDHDATDRKEKYISSNKNSKKKKKQQQRSHEHLDDEKENAKTQRGGGEGGGRKQITDPRFASAHRDPRFQRMPRHHSMVTVDARFADAFKEKRFALTTAPVDKRGKVRKGKQQSSMLRYYIQEKEPGADDAEEEEGAVRRRLLTLDDEEESSESGSGSSSSTSSSSEDEDEHDDQYSVSSDVAHYLMANHNDTPQTDEATRRLAVVNMDWDHIKAADIYVVMRSCLPKNGHIISIAIYPSEFGLKCMEVEATKGPSALINGTEAQDDSDLEDSDTDVDIEKENEKLRSYELNRLRYYYAVVDCDSSSTANHLYEALDGTELLKTSNVFDLRFIPDSTEFLHPARDIATEAPANYKEPDFHTRALQHSSVKLSWEEEEPKRKKILRRKFNADQLDDMELKEFLASDDEDSDEDEENADTQHDETVKLKQAEKYRNLLQSVDGSDAGDMDDQDMEITFNTGLEDIAKRALEKKDHKSETVWEAYLRRRKEKKKSQKKNAKYSSDDDDDESIDEYQQASDVLDQYDDFFEEEPSDAEVDVGKGKKDSADVPKTKNKKNKKDKNQSMRLLDKEQEASQAELELLCTNIDRPQSPSKDEDTQPEKGKKGKKIPAESKLPKDDYHNDPRFSALFTSHLYALDPTDPQFKRSATYVRQMVQKHKNTGRIDQSKISSEPSQLPIEKNIDERIDSVQLNDISRRKEQAEFLSVVRSLKRRTEALKSEKKGK